MAAFIAREVEAINHTLELLYENLVSLLPHFILTYYSEYFRRAILLSGDHFIKDAHTALRYRKIIGPNIIIMTPACT